MTLIITLVIIALIVFALFFWVISVQNKLVKANENTENALNQIAVQTESRFDSLTALNNLVKRYDTHEAETLEKIIGMRVKNASSVSDIQKNDETFSNALSAINAVAEQYPDLKAVEAYGKAMDSVNEREDQVRMARMVYNDSATIENRLIRAFPGSLVASSLGFTKREYLKMTDEKTAAPTMEA